MLKVIHIKTLLTNLFNWYHGDDNFRPYIKTSRRINNTGLLACVSLVLLSLAIVAPLYIHLDSGEAASRPATPSTLTYSATSSAATASLTVTSSDGTFATSTDGEKAAFSLSTDNASGYTVNVKSKDSTTALTNATTSTSLSSIDTTKTSSNFTNNSWGIIPSKYGSTSNTTNYYPITTSGFTMDETTTANTTANNYTLGLGLKADYSKPAGEYVNSSVVVEYVANPISYAAYFYSNTTDGSVSDMPTVNPVVGNFAGTSSTSITLPTAPTRNTYTFLGWCLGTSDSSNITTSNGLDTCTSTFYSAGDSFGLDGNIASSLNYYFYATWSLNSYKCTKQYRLQNANGTWGDYIEDTVASEQVKYGSTCTYSKQMNDYMNSENGTNNSTATAFATMNSTNGITVSLDLYRNKYALTVSASTNTSSPTGSGTYRWGQVVTVGVTKAANTTCITYANPTWTATAGTAPSAGTSVSYTMPKSAATMTATSSASNVSQTITLSRGTGVSSIKIGSTNYTTSSVSLTCGSYTVSGNYSSGYEFSSWARTNGVALSSTTAASTTMTVSGAGTLTLNAKSSWIWFQNATSANCGMIMRDNRGNSTYKNINYTTAKIGSLCWMTRNLDLPGGTELTSADSNVTSNYKLPTSSTSGFNDNTKAFVYNSSSTYNDTSCGDNDPCYSYYSFVAATAGTNPSGGAASSDICPKGWRLPTNSEMPSITSSVSSFSPVYSGSYDNSSFYGGGSHANWWSSTANDANLAYRLNYYNGSLTISDSRKRYGFSIRCVAKS